MKIPFVGADFRSAPVQFDPQTCVNFYPVKGSDISKTTGYLAPTPGLTSFSTNTGGSVRGLFHFNSVVYAVIDNTLYTINAAGTATSRGTLNSNTGRVSMTGNYTQICITDGTDMYTYTISSTVFAEVVDADFVGGVDRISYLDGYGVFTQSDDIWLTDLNNFSSITATSTATPSIAADMLVAAIPSHRELFIFGQHVTYVYWNSGATFPFEPREGILLDHGAAAAHAIVEVDNTLVWLSRNKEGNTVVVRANGYTPQIISDDALSQELGTYTTVSDAFAFSYSSQGHLFYVLTFPTENRTWVYDFVTKLWHQRSTRITNTPVEPFLRWKPNCYCFAFGKHLVGDDQSGNIYQISETTYTDNGTEIIRERITPVISSDLAQLCIDCLEVDMAVGEGLITGQGSDPKLMLSISKDGGQTWGSELQLAVGDIGAYSTRVRLNSLGTARNWAFKFRTSDPIMWYLFGLEAKIRKGAH